MKVAVIDDDKLALSSLTQLVKSAGIEVLSFSSAHEFLDEPDLGQIDCAVTDLRKPDVDGVALQVLLAQTLPHLSIVFISGHSDILTTVKAIQGGAVDFLEKPVSDKVLLEAIHRGAKRSADQRASRGEFKDFQKRYQLLIPREREVFKLVTSGLPNKRVGAELGATERTIKPHRARVMSKMNADSLAALVRMADRLHIPTPTKGE